MQKVIIEDLQSSKSEDFVENYQLALQREAIKAQQKLSDLKPIDISLYYKTKEERNALKMAKNDFKLYNIAHPSDGNVVRIQTCGGNPNYKGFTLNELLKEH